MESQVKEKSLVSGRESTCCQKVTLSISEASDCPSGTTNNDEKAQRVTMATFVPQ